jgi:hypothetical protein
MHAGTVSSRSLAVHQVAELRSRVHLLSFAIVQALGSHIASLGDLMHCRDSASRSCLSIMFFSINTIAAASDLITVLACGGTVKLRHAAPLKQFDPLHDEIRAWQYLICHQQP